MLTNDFLGDNIARLGFGAMRLPIIDGDASNVDQATLDAMVDTDIKAGVNYFDTAYPYHGGMSEIALGHSLARYPRDSYFFATKYPATRSPTSMIPPRSSKNSWPNAVPNTSTSTCSTTSMRHPSKSIWTSSGALRITSSSKRRTAAFVIWAFRVTVALKRSSVFLTMARASTPSLSSAILKLQPCSQATTSWNSARSS